MSNPNEPDENGQLPGQDVDPDLSPNLDRPVPPEGAPEKGDDEEDADLPSQP